MSPRERKYFAVIILLLLSHTIYFSFISTSSSKRQHQFLLNKNTNELIFDDDEDDDDKDESRIASVSSPWDGRHESLMQSPRGKEDTFQSIGAMQEERERDTSKFDKETAILITSNWIQSAPRIDIIQEVIQSISQLKGLSPRAPVFIIVDHLYPNVVRDRYKQNIDDKEREKRERTLEEYSFNLMREYGNSPNFHIVINKVNLHIGGNLNKTLHLLHNDTKFLYFAQHDFKFVTEINHTAIVKAMKDYPHRLKNVIFNKKKNRRKMRGDPCWDEPDAVLRVEGASFTKTTVWSDNNHFASVDFYKSVIRTMGPVDRPLEAPMQHKMFNGKDGNCSQWAQHLYGEPGQGWDVLHLDGRFSVLADKVSSANVTKAANVAN